MDQRPVLITGAAGSVARMLWPGLDGMSVRAVDTRDVDHAEVETVVGDLADRSFADHAVAGVDAVVHLAANPAAYASWNDLRRPNIDGMVNVVDAARAAGVRRLVLASSVHAMGAYFRPGERMVDPAWPARPCCAYGATKAFAESYGHMTAATSELSVICLRLGACQPRPVDTGALTGWLAPEDLQALVRCALTADVRAGAYFGVSANTRNAFDVSTARIELGYLPRHDSEDHAAGLPDGRGGMCRVTHPPVPSAA
ncbi:uronate dehydrogenase [Haloactinopolyspora alba]|uniref:Uronate dehydrogenase n=1 Tax=Haloactinopolyspora alba TaxID=648780 RepID=A0A2P8EB94_9ACTN|nr:NAD-dependent epimerase/dehydratase family protein [Haloactinopolyspora alba]PSL06728.1 uronate dehydrogenase [Haloactinopolyspora alba]